MGNMDDVVVGYGANAKKFEAESDKVQARIAKLEAQNAILMQRSKAGADSSAESFAKWGLQVVGVTSAASLATAAISSMVEQAKKIRELQDSISTKTEANQKSVFKELRAFSPEQQEALRKKMQQAQIETGASPEIISGIYSDLGQNGNKLSDVLSGKFDSLLELATVTGVKDSGSIVDTVNASFVRENKKDPTAAEYQQRAELLGTLGKDLPEATNLMAKLSAKITTEHGVALYEALKDRFGTAREATKHLTGKETEQQILRLANEDKASFEERLQRNRTRAASDFEGKLGIERGSLADISNRLDVKEQQVFGGKKITSEQERRFNQQFNEKYFKDDYTVQAVMPLLRFIASKFTADEFKIQAFAEPGMTITDDKGRSGSVQEIRQREYIEFMQNESRNSANARNNKAIEKNEDSKVNR